MTDSDYRHTIFIIDHSGSMEEILAGMQSGFSEFIAKQSAYPGKATASLWQFDDIIERVHAFQALEDLASYRLVPRGPTAMFDAIGQAATQEGRDLAAMPEGERPGVVYMIVVSDGLNNASREYTGSQIAEMLTHQQEAYGWVVIYLGTNQDAFKESASIGVASNSTLSYGNTPVASAGAWSATSKAVLRANTSRAAGQSIGFAYSSAERAEAAGEEADGGE
jgi:hypothetical protein